VAQFHAWFTTAQQSSLVSHPEACTFATAELPSGRVSARIVYLKELDSRGGFVVYSNFGTSRKAADLATNPHAALTFWWEALQRQVRVEGVAARMTREESQVYFDTRVRGSRIGAWASRQSRVLEPRAAAATSGAGDGAHAEPTEGQEDDGRAQLEEWAREREEQFAGQEHIPVPGFWGGLRIVPDRVEFWQGRENRLHDRFVYSREEGSEENEWKLERLSP
jgi:pyridoxamine 5'-phosphate oxidase